MSVLFFLGLMVIQATPEKTAPQAGDDNRLVCKSRPVTGSRVGSKICHTQAQWDAMSEQHMRDAKEMIDRPSIGSGRD